jgi:hypothetical protein
VKNRKHAQENQTNLLSAKKGVTTGGGRKKSESKEKNPERENRKKPRE